MADNQEFESLMQAVMQGSESASQELLERYGPHLLRAVRRKLHQKLRAKFDSLDFVQDVWASFFSRLPRALKFEKPEELIAFLTTVARNKMADVVRQRMVGQIYNVNREHSLENSTSVKPDQLVAGQPSPSEVFMGKEAWDKVLKVQPPVHRRVLLLLRDGKTPAHISQELGISQKTVSRIISKVLSRAPS